MAGYTVPHIETTRRTLSDPEARRVYLQEAIRDLLSGDPLDCALTLHVVFEAVYGFDEAARQLGLTAEKLDIALRNSTTISCQQLGQLLQFALKHDGLQVTADLLSATSIPAAALERQAA